MEILKFITIIIKEFFKNTSKILMLGNSNPSFYPRRQQDFSNFPTFTNLQPKTLVTPIKEDNLSNANRSFTIGEKLNFTNLSTKTP